MLQGWVVIAVALGYIGLLFVVASYGDRASRFRPEGRSRHMIYPLSLAIYCTSWTFFGSVGLASRTGFEFLLIYIGPIIMIGLCYPFILRVVRLAKAQNITSIADFIAARYGKSQAVAATVALIAIISTIPYIALQLKAVSASLSTIIGDVTPGIAANIPVVGDIALFVTLSMAAFAVLFGTRHIDATEHQDGLMLAIATESLVKLIAFLAVGVFVTYWMFDGPAELFTQALQRPDTAALLSREYQFGTIVAMTLLSMFAILLLPRQFHVTVVENHDQREVKRAAWLFPLYLVLINLFVMPIALAGLLMFSSNNVDGDMYVLALPLAGGSEWLALVAFVGGLSAATAMVIVESVALSIMVSNDIVVPLMLKRRQQTITEGADVGGMLLTIRRLAIVVILLLAYVYYRSAGAAQLASIGLLSFAAIAQLAPAFFGGMFWKRATARGAMAGITVGIVMWAYTLLLPSFADAGLVAFTLISEGPWGLALLRPQMLFGFELPPLVHGVVWSLGLNIIAYVGFSFTRAPAPIERLQGDLFVPSDLKPMSPSFRLWRPAVTIEELNTTVARYLGDERTRTSFDSYASTRGVVLDPKAEADFQLFRYAEHLLASAIGAASSRLVLSLLLRKRTVSTKAALRLLDDANAAIHYNREILQTALDHVRQGIAVFDKDQNLICWNRQFGEMLALPAQLTRVGAGLDEILRFNTRRNHPDAASIDSLVEKQLKTYASASVPFLERVPERDLVMEVRANRMPDGGIVTTFTDITASVKAAEELERANETLERRVRERTEQLTRLNTELANAKAGAEQANISKTRFLAAASHDILQPLNAARLYVTSLIERQGNSEVSRLVGNIDASLDAVEEIIGALLDISRLDTGAMKPEIVSLSIDEILRQLEVEFAPMAHGKGLRLDFVHCSLAVQSDRRLLRRLLQNLVSNAIKYTPQGRVLVGCRRRDGVLRIDVYDTGLGIPASKQMAIFQEFHRLDQGAKIARGLGLGLSIVERIARVLDHKVEVDSKVGRGSHFSIDVPLASTMPVREPRRAFDKIDRGQLHGIDVVCIDNDLAILNGMEIVLSGWGCRVLKAPDLATAITGIEQQVSFSPGVLLVDYHLDNGNGIEAIVELRKRHGTDLAAILITADRSPAVREEARAHDILILNKPVKPAALRALITQMRIKRAAAAE
jgi:Na+/proline symporter/signal transduction histidine kinase